MSRTEDPVLYQVLYVIGVIIVGFAMCFIGYIKYGIKKEKRERKQRQTELIVQQYLNQAQAGQVSVPIPDSTPGSSNGNAAKPETVDLPPSSQDCIGDNTDAEERVVLTQVRTQV